MGRYEELTKHLLKQKDWEIVLSFSEIEQLIGSPLPASKDHPQFWANLAKPHQRSSANKASREGGYSSFLLKGFDKVCFVRDP